MVNPSTSVSAHTTAHSLSVDQYVLNVRHSPGHRAKLAVTVVAALMDTVQAPVPVQPSPLQPVKM